MEVKEALWRKKHRADGGREWQRDRARVAQASGVPQHISVRMSMRLFRPER